MLKIAKITKTSWHIMFGPLWMNAGWFKDEPYVFASVDIGRADEEWPSICLFSVQVLRLGISFGWWW